MEWIIEDENKELDLNGSIMFTGLPGIGNVGKIVVDFYVDEFKAEKVCSFFSHSMPHSVFVNEDDLIEMPKIELYFKQINDKKFLFLVGDTQPIDERGTYSFCEFLLEYFKGKNGDFIVTLGGIGLQEIPKKPRVYCTGNNKTFITEFVKDTKPKLNTKIYGVVGPIMGVSGILLGLAGKKGIMGGSILAETLGHPMFLGLVSAREILKILNKKYEIDVNLKHLNKEIKEMEKRMKLATDLEGSKRASKGPVNYIG